MGNIFVNWIVKKCANLFFCENEYREEYQGCSRLGHELIFTAGARQPALISLWL